MSIPATASQALALQYQASGGGWVTVARCDIGSILRTRRLATPPGRPVTARKWRVVKLGADDFEAGVVRLTKIEARRETAELSPHKRWSFDFDTDQQRYGLIATDGNVEVYRRGERVASVRSPYTAQQLLDVKRAQMLDTLLAFHVDVPPYRIARQGAHSEWDSRPQAFENVPLFDYDGTRAGGVNEVQQLSFTDMENGETFNLTLEAKTTNSIAYSSNMATLAASVQAAMNALSNVGTNGVTVSSPADKTLRIAYQGVNRADDVGELVAAVLISAKGIVRTATVTQGKPGGEAVISATRGWPAAGVFFDSRLWLAAPRSRPQTIMASRSGFFFDLNIEGGEADKGISVDLATDQSTPILALFAGRHLQAFGRSAHFFCASSPITPPPAFPRTGCSGAAPGTPIMEMDGLALFVQAGGDTISRAILSTDTAEPGYEDDPLSDYASHLVKGVIAGGMKKGRSATEPHLALWVKSDGTAAAMVARMKQDVLGFNEWTTAGAFTEAGGELAGDLYVCTRRMSGGVERHRLEVLDEACVLDAAVRVDGPCEEITGLGHLEGRTVVAYIDGADAGDVVVTGGRIALPYPAQRSAEAGLLFVPRGRCLPLVLQQDPRGGASMHARSGEIAMRLGPTANLKTGMTGKRMWPLALKRRGGETPALLDHGPGEDAFEGWTRLYPVPGFQNDAQIDWVQERPGPLEIREVVVTVQS